MSYAKLINLHKLPLGESLEINASFLANLAEDTAQTVLQNNADVEVYARLQILESYCSLVRDHLKPSVAEKTKEQAWKSGSLSISTSKTVQYDYSANPVWQSKSAEEQAIAQERREIEESMRNTGSAITKAERLVPKFLIGKA